jgi:hypothetical protein
VLSPPALQKGVDSRAAELESVTVIARCGCKSLRAFSLHLFRSFSRTRPPFIMLLPFNCAQGTLSHKHDGC